MMEDRRKMSYALGSVGDPGDLAVEGTMEHRFGCDAVLFDLDGVLVDSTSSVERAWRWWAERHGLETSEVLAVAHGRRTTETVALVAPHLDAEAEAMELERKEIEDAGSVLPFDGAVELLAALSPQRWAIVTSGTTALAHARLEACGMPIPNAFIGAGDVTRGKPDPECYLKGARLLGIAPDRCVVVEDAPSGISAARAAGAAVIAVATTHPGSELSEADAVARTVDDVRLDRGRGQRSDGFALEIVVDIQEGLRAPG